jgi:type IV pilus assembly protein PilM
VSARAVGIDVGGTTARLVEGRLKGGAFEIHAARAFPVDELPQQVAALGLMGQPAVVGVTGRDMILRTNQVPPVPTWQLKELMSFEVADIAEQSGDQLAADFEMLGGAAAFSDEDMVLLALVRNSLIEERQAELAAAALKARCFTPNAVALYNAVVATDGGDGTVLVACLRGRNTDIAMIQDGELLFARNLTGGGDTFTEAVAEAFGADQARAEQAKHKLGRFARPGEKLGGQADTVSDALQSALRQVVGMLLSTANLCRTQLKAPNLEIGRVLICGPGARIPGLDEALTRQLGLPVEMFDPTEGYVVGSQVDFDDEGGGDFAVATGLAMMALLKGSYRIEILSEAAARAREFQTKTLWLVLSGVLLAAYLGTFGWLSARDHDAARVDTAKLTREAGARRSARDGYTRDADRAEAVAAGMARIELVTAPGHGVVTVLGLLRELLPEELWITSLRTSTSAKAELGSTGIPRPIIVVEGSGKELERDLNSAVADLTVRLREHASIHAVVPTMSTDARGRFTYELQIDPSLRPGSDVDADEEGDD